MSNLVQMPAPPPEEITVKQLIEMLRLAKDQNAKIRLTDTEGSFNESVFTVEEADGEVYLVAPYFNFNSLRGL